MMTRLFATVALLMGITATAQSISFPVSSTFSPAGMECNAKILGGVDGFPWSVAKPFPWADIQGVWKLKDGLVPYFLKAKVVRTTSNRKILNLSVVSDKSCTKAIAQGVGYIDLSEKNVVRAIISDGTSKYQLKIALFNIEDLAIDGIGCGDGIMAASLRVIGTLPPTRNNALFTSEDESRAENVLLKKVSSDLGAVCKKAGNK